MSNKVLIASIVGILLLFGITIAGIRMFGRSAVSGTANNRQPPAEAFPEQSTTTPQLDVTAKPPTNSTAACQTSFDPKKLTNDKVNIQNRVVEISVKNFGVIKLEFYEKDAPKTVENFLRLVNSGFYNCLTFHRIAKGFVIQGGDPNGNGTGGQSAFGKAFADELNAQSPSYKAGYLKGVLAMANSGPNTNGSQFFIMLADNELPHLYTIFGKVSSGIEVVDKIGQVAINPQLGPTDGSPVTPVVMESVKIIK